MITLSYLSLLALVLSALVIVALRRPAEAIGLADRPGGRKQHQGVVPLTGGLGVFVGFLLVQPLLPGQQRELLPLFAGMALLVACGVIDDARDMRCAVKLGVQLVAAVLMVAWGQRMVVHIGDYPGAGAVQLGWLAAPFTVLAVAGLINAVNMMDGLDGLAGGVVLAMLAWLGFIAALQGQLPLLAVIASLGAAVAGFMIFNLRHPWRKCASVFMGDAGSMALGFATAWFVVELSQQPRAVISPVAFGWILVLPMVDTLSLAIRRLHKGQSPFAADREHLHHLFLRAGFGPGATTLALVLITFALGAVGVLGSLAEVPDVLLLLALAAVVVLHNLFTRHAWRTSRALRRLHAASCGPALLGSGALPSSLLLRARPIVQGWRRDLALAGLYLAVFTLTLDARVAAVGSGMVLLATLLAWPAFWRDASRLALFWVIVALAFYLVARSLGAGVARPVSPDWQPLVLMTGVISLPLGWWLAQSRLHWPWLLMTLLLGSIAAFVMQADWLQLESGLLTNPWVWGPPAQTGFLASVGLMLLLAMLFSGLQRLGTGWRPTYKTGLASLMCMPVIMVLVATHYATGWVGAMAGLLCFALATPLLGRHQGRRLGLLGLLALLALLLVGLLSWQLLFNDNRTIAEGLLHPLQAMVLMLQDETRAAHAVHPGSTERLLLWAQAWHEWRAHPLIGSGSMAPEGQAGWLAGYRGYHSLYAGVAAGFGLVGLLGFLCIVAIYLRAVVLLAIARIWPSAWALGLLSSSVAVMVMFILAVPIRDHGTLAMVILLMAGCCTAVFQRRWIAMRRANPSMGGGAM